MKSIRPWIRATVFLAIGAAVGFAAAHWLCHRVHVDRVAAARRERERRLANMALVRRPRPLTEDETALIRDFIAKARRYRGTDDAAAEVAQILVSVGVSCDELASVFGVSEEVLREWEDPAGFFIWYRSGVSVSFGLDEGGRIFEAYTFPGLVRAVAEEGSNGELRAIERRGHDWQPPPPETPSPSGDEPEQSPRE
jgi:hypothetical protein